MNWIIARFNEPSSRAGLAGILAGVSALTPPGGPAQQILISAATLLGGSSFVQKG